MSHVSQRKLFCMSWRLQFSPTFSPVPQLFSYLVVVQCLHTSSSLILFFLQSDVFRIKPIHIFQSKGSQSLFAPGVFVSDSAGLEEGADAPGRMSQECPWGIDLQQTYRNQAPTKLTDCVKTAVLLKTDVFSAGMGAAIALQISTACSSAAFSSPLTETLAVKYGNKTWDVLQSSFVLLLEFSPL